MTISGEIADADAAERAFRELRGPDPEPITLTGAQRRFLIECLEANIETLDRAARATKVRHERQRFEVNAEGARRCLDTVKVVAR